MAHHEMRIMVNKMQVARVSGTSFEKVEQSAFSYAFQYREEGDVTVQKQVRTGDPDGKWRWKRHAFFAAVPA